PPSAPTADPPHASAAPAGACASGPPPRPSRSPNAAANGRSATGQSAAPEDESPAATSSATSDSPPSRNRRSAPPAERGHQRPYRDTQTPSANTRPASTNHASAAPTCGQE